MEIIVIISFVIPIYERQEKSYISIEADMGYAKALVKSGFLRQKLITDKTDANAGKRLRIFLNVKRAEIMLHKRKNISQNLLFAHFLSLL